MDWLSIILLAYVASVVVVMVGMTVLFVKAWRREVREMRGRPPIHVND